MKIRITMMINKKFAELCVEDKIAYWQFSKSSEPLTVLYKVDRNTALDSFLGTFPRTNAQDFDINVEEIWQNDQKSQA